MTSNFYGNRTNSYISDMSNAATLAAELYTMGMCCFKVWHACNMVIVVWLIVLFATNIRVKFPNHANFCFSVCPSIYLDICFKHSHMSKVYLDHCFKNLHTLHLLQWTIFSFLDNLLWMPVNLGCSECLSILGVKSSHLMQ